MPSVAEHLAFIEDFKSNPLAIEKS